VAVQQVDGRGVEPGRVERDHGGVGLTGAAGGEQLVDVDAAFEHDHPGPRLDQLEHRRLPRGTRGDHQDDEHVSPGRPR
jgi:hypothetical protein